MARRVSNWESGVLGAAVLDWKHDKFKLNTTMAKTSTNFDSCILVLQFLNCSANAT